jgi:hypothetical protein
MAEESGCPGSRRSQSIVLPRLRELLGDAVEPCQLREGNGGHEPGHERRWPQREVVARRPCQGVGGLLTVPAELLLRVDGIAGSMLLDLIPQEVVDRVSCI